MSLITRFGKILSRHEYLDVLRPPSPESRLQSWKDKFQAPLDEQESLNLEMKGLEVKRNFKWLRGSESTQSS